MSLFTSENQIVCFPSFVLTVFWCSTSYTVLIVFWMLLLEPVDALARWWPCAGLKCVPGLRRLEKTLNFWDAYMSLTWSSNMVQTKMKETGFSFSLNSLCWWVELPPLLEWVFFSCLPGFRLKSSRIALSRKRLQFDSKSDLAMNGLILGFYVGKWLLPLTFCLYELKCARIAQF